MRSQVEVVIERRRRRRGASLSSALSLTCLFSSVFLYQSSTDAFAPLHYRRGGSLHVRNSVVPRQSQSPDSKKKERRSSPLKVRKRVKDVLEKAKNRTGIDNMSDGKSRSDSIVADAASIGGFSDGELDFMMQDSVLNGAADGKSEPKSASFSPENGVTAPKNGKEVGEKYQRDPQDFEEMEVDSPLNTEYIEALPFELPKLSKEQIQRLRSGERIQEQSRMGREGSGYVVLDVHAPAYCVWECLLDFESYPELISTVREFQLYTSQKLSTGYVNEKPVLPGTGRETRHYGTPSITRAMFTLSKFRLKIAAIHKYTPHPKGDYMVFTLDRSCTNMVLKGAKGIWHTVENPEGREVRIQRICSAFRMCNVITVYQPSYFSSLFFLSGMDASLPSVRSASLQSFTVLHSRLHS